MRCAQGARALINLLPDTPDTRGILNHTLFSVLADDAIVINMARGSHLVDEDLLTAIEHGKVGAAMLDVFHVEPLPANHPFWRNPRIAVTPHVAAITLRDEAVAQIVAKIAALESGRPITGIVDLDRGY
jgi:glyoxylate/hydroxypyruvate reductase A